jgi:hypothetical protein
MIENKVEKSGLIQMDLNDFVLKGTRSIIDIKDFLFEGIILKEKDFREKLDKIDWSIYTNHFVGITCSVEAIIPLWAYMVITSKLTPYASIITRGNKAHLEGAILRTALEKLNPEEYKGKKVIVKGCGGTIPESAYMLITTKLQPVVQSLMFGEACSTVPVFKSKN